MLFVLHNFACWTAQSEFWTAQIGWTARLELGLRRRKAVSLQLD